jgi:hypothetical protein
MSFNINLPESPTIDDFKKAKSSLVVQFAKKSARAPSMDQYAFNQKISESRWNIRKAFQEALRVLIDACALECPGETLMDAKAVDKITEDQ